jgi:hypothetical protein
LIKAMPTVTFRRAFRLFAAVEDPVFCTAMVMCLGVYVSKCLVVWRPRSII